MSINRQGILCSGLQYTIYHTVITIGVIKGLKITLAAHFYVCLAFCYQLIRQSSDSVKLFILLQTAFSV